MHDEFAKKQEAYTNEYSAKRETFDKEAAEFQEKLQRGGFLSEQRAVQVRDRLLTMEQEIQRMDQVLSTKLNELETENNKKVLDNLMEYLKEYNKEAGYDYIFNGANILIGDETHNVTAHVLKVLNERYVAINPE